MNVHKKLMQARIQLQNTELKKSGHNKFAGYYYFELGDFLPTVQNIFNSLGLCGVVSYDKEIAYLEIIDMDDQSSIRITSPMGSAQLKGCHEVQNIGAVETYQRRYLWVTAMEIVEHDVLDATTGSKFTETGVKKPNHVSVAQDSYQTLPEGSRLLVDEIGIALNEYLEINDVSGAHDFLERAGMETEQKAALWSLLDSKSRSALKAESLRRNAEKNLDA